MAENPEKQRSSKNRRIDWHLWKSIK
jgi:hypothetical protein